MFWTVSVARVFLQNFQLEKESKPESARQSGNFRLQRDNMCIFLGTKDTAAELPTKTPVWWIYRAFSTSSHLIGIIIRSAGPNSANQPNPPKRMLNYHPYPSGMNPMKQDRWWMNIIIKVKLIHLFYCSWVIEKRTSRVKPFLWSIKKSEI